MKISPAVPAVPAAPDEVVIIALGRPNGRLPSRLRWSVATMDMDPALPLPAVLEAKLAPSINSIVLALTVIGPPVSLTVSVCTFELFERIWSAVILIAPPCSIP